MLWRHGKPVRVFGAGLLCLAAAVAMAQTQAPPKRKHPVKQEQPAPVPDPPPPPAPLTLEQLPASPPTVLFRNGMLTIAAENSTLGDILRAVRSQTGAAVEVPGNATERVVSHLGPGPARDVLAALLNGSHFNYVMLGSATNPTLVDRIILTSKSGGEPPAAPNGAGGGNRANNAQDQGEIPLAQEPDEMPADDTASADDSDNQADGQANQGEEQQQPSNAQAPVKTPEQLLRELQQQQQQNPPQDGSAPQNPPPRQQR